MATSVKIGEFILAKLITYFILGFLTFTLLVLFTIFVFNVPFRGSILALAFSSSIFLLTAIGLGLYISTISKNQLVASQAAINTGFLPAYMLSGFLFEISTMPEPIRIITYAMPARYFVTSLQTLFLAGNVWPLLLGDIAIMIGMAIFLFFLAATRTVKRLD
jgi:ABC-2 type transport system permease protein